MAKRTCEICGRPTAEADFSKSYKRRCKECVAREAREARAAKCGTKTAQNTSESPAPSSTASPTGARRRRNLWPQDFLRAGQNPRSRMTELIKEAIAPLIALAVYLILTRIERRGYERGYEDAMKDRRPKHRPRVGFRTKDTDK